MSERRVMWSPAAAAAVMAMRRHQDASETIDLGAALFALAQDLPPGSSGIASALRDQAVWPNYITFLSQWTGNHAVGAMLSGLSMIRWEWEAEQRARADGSFRVGERHLIPQIHENHWREIGVDAAALVARVREYELGPALPIDLLSQMRHAMLDLSALIEYRQPDEIRWTQALGQGPVMIWLVSSVLNELDDAKRADRRRLRKRAQARSRWIWERLDAALGDTGVQIDPTDGTRIKAWAPSISGLRDTDHLEAALTLRSMGLDLLVVSDDTLMGARGKLAGIRVIRLPDWRVQDEEESGAPSGVTI